MSSLSIDVQTKDLKSKPGVELDSEQKTIIGSVLDLFKGLPSKEKLSLWKDDAVFEDPLTDARGRSQFEAQWYGLAAAFSKIELQSHEVISAGNPIVLDVKNLYTVKGINKEQLIQSKIEIYVGPTGKIEKVLDKWDGSIPDGPFASAFRRLNAKVVPGFVSVPKDAAEEAKKSS
ncbi:hypothetical protein EJ05DRAFT_489699 [Pseudovirgaria hyperparasitica]|uniref:SnoaL-like domain-containing protein n=1 Tax=Pseudovirgaria hyperparasitica TaxID=470096 RepID=A0A6A6VTH5_9PEZI|nr:uncharacterized protein EJ05DRAFT_489699 [Pseudovirgaria hyperparasitica]KAF2753988.1 hypothetical protein EJ05DRAFT_489699 [Pseudovirgaria hyperparasitica]